VDLNDAGSALPQVHDWLTARADRGWQGVNLVNNAGMLPTLSRLCEVPAAELQSALRVGLEAAVLLSAAFLGATKDWTLPRRILLISSGVGRRPLTGAGVYSVAKAGLDHLARALAAEQAPLPNGARVVSLAPGTIETDMQVQLRQADPGVFAHHRRFQDLHRQGLVDSTEAAAAKVLAYLARPGFGEPCVADVREN
jgi:NAD(P)-dependent dehydrogenase (short-subunit alcohol dehydrogenase family)